AAVKAGNFEQGLQFAGKGKMLVVQPVEKRFFAEAIATQQQRARTEVPYRDGEHAVEVVEHRLAPFAVSVHDDFGVGAGLKGRPPRFKLAAQLAVVVYFAVEDDMHGLVATCHRLMPAGKVDDRKAAHAEHGLVVDMKAIVVGATMTN